MDITFTDQSVLDAAARGESWADTVDDPTLITDWPHRQAKALIPFRLVDDRPYNPAAPTGIRYGRNLLGRWGEQACADALVTIRDRDGHRWVAMIDRDDDFGWAVPGGTADPGETPAQAAARELREETGLWISADNTGWQVGTPRNVSDPRASDEAWMVTVLCRYDEVGRRDVGRLPKLQAGDDARQAAWVRADTYADLVANLRAGFGGQVFAAHRDMLAEAIDGTAN